MKKIKSSETKKRRFRYFKILIGLFLGVMILNASKDVNAGINDTVIDKNRVNGIYAIVEVGGGVNRIFYLNMYKMNGRTAYCIDVGVDITTDIYNSTNDFGISYLTKEQIDYIRTISYFGYGYLGHDSYKYYMAAQEIIWEYLSGRKVFWSNEMNVNQGSNEIDVNSYKEEIIRLSEEYIKGIDIRLDRDEYYIGEEIEIIPSNGNINEYVVSSSKYSSASIRDNKLVIKVGNNIGNENIELSRKGVYDYEELLYYYDNSQRLISNGNISDNIENISFKIKGVDLEVKVVDSMTNSNKPYVKGASLEGAIYEIRDENDNLIGTYETDKDGKFNISGLLYGKYYIKQIKASVGYEYNGDVKGFVIDRYNNELVLIQTLISNDFRINKVYGEGNNYRPEAGIRFDIYNDDNELVYIVVTDDSGIANVKLFYGNYIVRQNNTTVGYDKVDDFGLEVKDSSDNIININLVNDKILVKLKVMTYEEKKDKPLLMGGFAYKIKKKEENTYLEYNGEDIFYADDKGELVIPVDLDYGDYFLEQVDSPNGVILNKEKYEIKIDDNSELSLVNNNLVMEVLFYNELAKGKVIVNTLEEMFNKSKNKFEYKNIARDNVEVKLYADEDIVSNGELIFSKDSLIFSGNTNDNGMLEINDLYLGKYCIEDSSLEEKKCFELVSNNNYDKVIEEKVSFVKVLEKSDIVISNVNEQGEPIDGSIFEVVDKDGDVIYTGSTNDEGIIKVKDLVKGDYCIRQKSVNGDYELNLEDMCIVLNEDKRVEFVNKGKVRRIVVPNTWSSWNGNLWFYGACLVGCLIGTGVLVYKKIFASKLYR